VGIRPGEKIHEQMIGPEDAVNTYDMGEYYVIIPQDYLLSKRNLSISEDKRVPPDFTYSSETNSDWMTKNKLHDWISRNTDSDGKVPLK
jgi:UDP-N-acetylglucosamine 4,6-dehydratase